MILKYRIHFTLSDGTEDSIVLTGSTIQEIRENADIEVNKRGGIDPWSEEL